METPVQMLAQFCAEAYTASPDISGAWNTSLIIRQLGADAGGVIIVAFQGTRNIGEVFADLDAWPAHIGTTNVHAGFYSAYTSLGLQLEGKLKAMGWSAERPVILTGHSLGGALAMMGAWVLGLRYPAGWISQVVTFGQPRVGNGAFKLSYEAIKCVAPGGTPGAATGTVALPVTLKEATWRFVNAEDVVPHLPLADFLWGYRHAGQEVYLDDLNQTISNPSWWVQLIFALWACGKFYLTRKDVLIADHFMAAYQAKLGTMAAGAAGRAP